MKNDIFITRLARTAAASAMVGIAVTPSHHPASPPVPPVLAEECAILEKPVLLEEESQSSTAGNFMLTITNPPSTWDGGLERKFRQLALAEATGKISKNDASRLEALSNWRNQLVSPPTVEETLLQLKRDRLLSRMEDLLKEYVEFKEGSGYARSAT